MGWNLTNLSRAPEQLALLDMGFIWHIQVTLILIGHLMSVCAAHMILLRVFYPRRQALVIQIPSSFS